MAQKILPVDSEEEEEAIRFTSRVKDSRRPWCKRRKHSHLSLSLQISRVLLRVASEVVEEKPKGAS